MRHPGDIGDHWCPGCGHFYDAATEPLDQTAVPAWGDLCVCAYCRVAMEFNPVGQLQLVNEHNLSLEEKAYLARLRRALKKVGPPPSARQSRN